MLLPTLCRAFLECRAFLARRRGARFLRGNTNADRRAGGLKMDWTKPGRFGRVIALWALNGIDQFCFGSRSTDRLRGWTATGSILPAVSALPQLPWQTGSAVGLGLPRKRFSPMCDMWPPEICGGQRVTCIGINQAVLLDATYRPPLKRAQKRHQRRVIPPVPLRLACRGNFAPG